MNENDDTNSFSPSSPENIDVRIWIRWIRQLGLPNIFSSLPDARKKFHITYSLSTLVMWAFSLCVFRLCSKHAMQTSLRGLSPDRQQGVLQLLGSDQIPHSCTVDQALQSIDYLFDRLKEGKFFYNHPELIPN